MPRRTTFFLAALLALVLAACQGRSTPAIEPASPTATTITATPIPPTNTVPPAQPTTVISQEIANCTVVSPLPTPGPTERSMFKPVGEDDWQRGPEDAAVTVIEYSDFQ